jgi:integrase
LPDAFCFSPRDAVEQLLKKRRESRTTPESCGNRPGTNVRAKPRRQAGNRYSKDSYNRAIARGIAAANEERQEQKLDPLPHWSANRLRHSAATDIRRRFGLEAAQVILGHAKADITQVYAETNAAKAAEVARQVC